MLIDVLKLDEKINDNNNKKSILIDIVYSNISFYGLFLLVTEKTPIFT